ncbi:BPSL0067 family protein [Massilia endophytica]|uniref:BPSL0067 family protein n=1 Tax=Massilia endophytica TaxID=2899220 RepID=UPI001E41518D|nr:BPSL0067 family protein [Massilia endophytica]UGQ46352.1 BPSL0067 family protein [Massilia endophytica]
MPYRLADPEQLVKPHGNHAALVLSVIRTGIWVVDQWNTDPQRTFVDRRFIRVPPRNPQRRADGSFIRPSDNALAFSVIELC